MTKNPKEELGLVYYYCGSMHRSSLLGQAVRTCGHGFKVCIVFFLRRDFSWDLLSLQRAKFNSLGLEFFSFGPRCEHTDLLGAAAGDFCEKCFSPNPGDAESVQKAVGKSGSALSDGKYDLVILADSVTAVEYGYLGLGELLSLLKRRGKNVEVAISGESLQQELIRDSDLVSNFIRVK